LQAFVRHHWDCETAYWHGTHQANAASHFVVIIHINVTDLQADGTIGAVETAYCHCTQLANAAVHLIVTIIISIINLAGIRHHWAFGDCLLQRDRQAAVTLRARPHGLWMVQEQQGVLWRVPGQLHPTPPRLPTKASMSALYGVSLLPSLPAQDVCLSTLLIGCCVCPSSLLLYLGVSPLAVTFGSLVSALVKKTPPAPPPLCLIR